MKAVSPYPKAIACLAASFFSLSPTAKETPPQRDRKTVFIAGKASHGAGEHEHRAGSLLFAGHMGESGLPMETVVVTNGWPED